MRKCLISADVMKKLNGLTLSTRNGKCFYEKEKKEKIGEMSGKININVYKYARHLLIYASF